MDSASRVFIWTMMGVLAACGPVQPPEVEPASQAHRSALQTERWYGTITSTLTQQRSQNISLPLGPECHTYEKDWEETTSSTLRVNLLGDHATMDWSWRLRQDGQSVETHCSECVHRSTESLAEDGGGNVPVDFGFGIDADTGLYGFTAQLREGGPLEAIGIYNEYNSGCGFTDRLGEPIAAVVSHDAIYVLDQTGDPRGNSFSGSTTRPYTDEGLVATEVITWNFSRVLDLELVVKPRGYEDWRPRGSLDPELPGDVLWVEATVQQKDGSPSDVPAMWIQFELTEASKVPGVAMNHPPVANVEAETYDLDFSSRLNPHLVVSGERKQVARTPDGAYLTELAGVASYDWGAYGELTVTAQLTDGRRLTGHLKGSPETRILLPQRAPDSFIADSWKRESKAWGLSDSDDTEDEPKSDVEGHTGDGLTLYEEYRGFIEGDVEVLGGKSPKLAWASGQPRTKELFVVNEVGPEILPGLDLFEKATGLVVQGYVSSKHVSPQRVVNFRRHPRADLHRVDQHAVLLQMLPEYSAFAQTFPRPGLPGEVEFIGFSDNYITPPPGGTTDSLYVSPEQLRWVVAHELAHACTVEHHGNTDWPRSWRINASQQVEELDEAGTSQVIRLLRESDLATLSPKGLQIPDDWWVTEWHGQSSGDEQCLMRYVAADASVYREQPGGRILFGREAWGSSLCTGKEGHGFNSSNWFPHSRHGSATLGDCRHQVCVSDYYGHHSR